MQPHSMLRPRCLIVPGLNNSGPRHWQSRWEETRDDCVRVDLGAWSNPHRSHWTTKLDLAIAREQVPVILVAHSLGCLAVAWWAALAEPARQKHVVGAMLVAPPDVERPETSEVLRRFAPAPLTKFQFPTILVASRDDPYATIERSQLFARRWGAEFYDMGEMGHINADSFLGEWAQGQVVLDFLIGGADETWTSPANPFGKVATERPTLRGH